MTIGLIARDDYPEQWPSLLDTLMGLVCSADVNAVQGAIRALVMFAEDIQEHQLPAVAQHLFPVLLRVLAAKDVRVSLFRALSTILPPPPFLHQAPFHTCHTNSIPPLFRKSLRNADLSPARSNARHHRLPHLSQLAV